MDQNNIFENHKIWVENAGRKGKQLNLSDTDFSSSYDHNIIFEQSYIAACRFSGIEFNDRDFYAAELYSCEFIKSVFNKCDFRKATLDYSNFSNSKFKECTFVKTDLYQAILSNSEFINCSFKGVNFMECNMKYCTFKNIDFDNAYFDKVNLYGAKFYDIKNIDNITHIVIDISDGLQNFICDNEAKKWILMNCQA